MACAQGDACGGNCGQHAATQCPRARSVARSAYEMSTMPLLLGSLVRACICPVSALYLLLRFSVRELQAWPAGGSQASG